MYESGCVASGHFVLGRDVLCEFAVNMPPTKVCPQGKAAVPVRRKTCERCDNFNSNKKQSVICERKQFNSLKRMGAVESAKGKLHKACERESETRE